MDIRLIETHSTKYEYISKSVVVEHSLKPKLVDFTIIKLLQDKTIISPELLKKPSNLKKKNLNNFKIKMKLTNYLLHVVYF